VFRDVDVSGSKPTIEREGFRQMPGLLRYQEKGEVLSYNQFLQRLKTLNL
jgi:hypothetical protein